MSGLDYRHYFEQLREQVAARIELDYSLWFAAEVSEFARFNRGRLNQLGTVEQALLTLNLGRGEQRQSYQLTLSGDVQQDLQRIQQYDHDYRHTQTAAPAPDTEAAPPWQLERQLDGSLPELEALVGQVVARAAGHDLVGFYSAGPIFRGHADSRGNLGWHQADSFNFSWSLFHASGHAIKESYAGNQWSDARFGQLFDGVLERFAVLDQPERVLTPGAYRVYLAPAAVSEFFALLNQRGGFSARELSFGRSPLSLLQHESRLDPRVQLRESAAAEGALAFNDEGYPRQDLDLLGQGRLLNALVSAESARELGIAANGAAASESASALQLAAGNLPEAQVLQALGDGLYIGNLWYLNYSDRASARITGLTRFACFWVEQGRIVAPINTMRFDESLLDILGEQLIDLTAERRLFQDAMAARERSTQSGLYPGLLLKRFHLTL